MLMLTQHPEHVDAKKKGRTDFYAEYKIQTCSLLRESRFPVSLGT